VSLFESVVIVEIGRDIFLRIVAGFHADEGLIELVKEPSVLGLPVCNKVGTQGVDDSAGVCCEGRTAASLQGQFMPYIENGVSLPWGYCNMGSTNVLNLGADSANQLQSKRLQQAMVMRGQLNVPPVSGHIKKVCF
jgi:hypothetical protein